MLKENRSTDASWLIEQEGFDPSRERELESIFSLGNGYLGVRGSIEILIPTCHSDLFIAGIYDRKAEQFPYSETEFMTKDNRQDLFAELVPIPSPFPLRINIDGEKVLPEWILPQTFQRTLEMKTATLFSKMQIRDPSQREWRIRSSKCVSLADPHILLQEVEVTSNQFSGEVKIEPFLNDQYVLLNFPHLCLAHHARSCEIPYDLYLLETKGSKHQIAIASITLMGDQQPVSSSFTLELQPNQPILFRRMIAVYTSRDTDTPALSASRKLVTENFGFQSYVADHMERWNQFWLRADIEFCGDPITTQAQRFNNYHLRIAADHDPRNSVPARGLTGRAYEGHIFWDAEIFILPFYSHLFSDIARSCLTYRYQTLEAAKRRALSMGYAGACYAWESTETGDDVTPHSLIISNINEEIPIFTGFQQIHISADVAFGISRYWETTSDHDFMERFGAEILLETARFWASRVHEDRNQFHIRGVIGPDEYHHDVTDNVYTNWMARFNLTEAAKVLDWLRLRNPARYEKLASQILLKSEEPQLWREVARRIYIPKPNSEGVIEQFQGFFDLRRPDKVPNHQLKAPIDRLIHWKQVDQMQLIKQADVLMIPYLFRGAFSGEVLKANYLYYEPLTDHGSSLSPPVYAAIAWEVGQLEDAKRYWHEGLNIDLLNLMHNTALGLHLGCMGGCWQTLMFHFLKMENEEGYLEKA